MDIAGRAGRRGGGQRVALLGRERRGRHRDDRARRLPSLRQLDPPPRRRAVDRHLAALRGAASPAGGRVLLPDHLRDDWDDVHGFGPRPDGHLPGPGADVDRGLRAGRVQPARPPQRRGGPEVLPARRLREQLSPLRHRTRLRSGGQRQPARDRRGGPGRLDPAGPDDPGRFASGDRVRLQGGGGPLPHVDPGRLRGRADAGDRVHGRCREGGLLRGVSPGVRSGARRRLRPVVDRPVVAGGDHDGGGQRRCAGPVQRQAHAGLLLDRARGLSARGAGRGQRHRRRGAPVLPCWSTR